MKAIRIEQPTVGTRAERWLHAKDLNFSDSGHDWSSGLPTPTGVATESGWVVFQGRQVVVSVPDEVHSYWHHKAAGEYSNPGAWHVEGSTWLASFDQTHLSECSHFILELRDWVVEVICKDLLFGEGAFDLERAIERHPPLADAHFWRAQQREKAGNIDGAVADYLRAARAEGAFFRKAARDHLVRLGRES